MAIYFRYRLTSALETWGINIGIKLNIFQTLQCPVAVEKKTNITRFEESG